MRTGARLIDINILLEKQTQSRHIAAFRHCARIGQTNERARDGGIMIAANKANAPSTMAGRSSPTT